MMPFSALTPEQKLQVTIVRIDIVLVAIWHVLRIVLPILCVAALLIIAIRFWRRRRAR